jgi:cell division protein FtsL
VSAPTADFSITALDEVVKWEQSIFPEKQISTKQHETFCFVEIVMLFILWLAVLLEQLLFLGKSVRIQTAPMGQQRTAASTKPLGN